MDSDRDLLVRWAAEEFVAAGRGDTIDARLAHRRRALFFAEISEALRDLARVPGPRIVRLCELRQRTVADEV